jgi:DNA-binding NarL/FixJ family response regulator
MSNVKRIVIIEDNTLLRQCIEAMFAKDLDVEFVGFATNGKDAIELANRTKPDLMLIDLSLSLISGIDAMIEIRKRNPLIKVLVLTVHIDKQYIRDALIAGANGYSVMYDTPSELIYAVKNVLSGKAYLSPNILNLVIAGYLEKTISSDEDLLWRTVTHREREIMKLIAEGFLNQDIANLMNLSLKTVKTHRANIMKKLDLHNVISLTSFAIGKGLVVSNKCSAAQKNYI